MKKVSKSTCGDPVLVHQQVREHVWAFGLQGKAKLAKRVESLGSNNVDEQVDVGVAGAIDTSCDRDSVHLRDNAAFNQGHEQLGAV